MLAAARFSEATVEVVVEVSTVDVSTIELLLAPIICDTSKSSSIDISKSKLILEA
jgi:hypothetical protein